MIKRELGIENLKIDWSIRAMRYEYRCREKENSNIVKMCWNEKDGIEKEKKDMFSKERESRIKVRMQDIQNQNIDGKVRSARYNKRFKAKEKKNGKPNYLLTSENLDKI